MHPLSPPARLPILMLGGFALVFGVLAGLARLAVTVPPAIASLAGVHGALMVAAFLGTVISLERAVALGRGWPYLAPLAAGIGGFALLAGLPTGLAQLLFVASSALLTVGSVSLLRQPVALHTATLALGAFAWLVGNLAWWLGGNLGAAVPWWMAFLVITIAGERLELTRLLPTPRSARQVFLALIALQLGSLVVAFWLPAAGWRLFAASLLGLALWLLRHDIARRNVSQSGITRYLAVCLLGGYAWLLWASLLGLAGGFTPGSPLRDAALHAVFLGFVFSMIFGHAPIIFPAVTRFRIPYHPAFYLPLFFLHVSLLAREIGALAALPQLLRAAGLANALALVLLVLTLVVSVLRGLRPNARPPGMETLS